MKSNIALSLIAIAAIASPVTAFAKHKQAAKGDRHAVQHTHMSSARAATAKPRSLLTVSATAAPEMKPMVPAKPK